MDATRSSRTIGDGILPVCKDVQEFIQAAEKLLSPALRATPLTAEECFLIREYVMSMSNARHPWSKGLSIKR